MIYSLLAPVYDIINKDVDYSAWADFIEAVIKKEYKPGRPELVLDLGCGTGRMTLELGRRGYDMTGVDQSPEMLDIARYRAVAEGLDGRMLWLCQDMCDFELYGTVDLTVSCLDCINHLTSNEELERCFALVHNYLSPDGLFIFDVNGKGKFERTFADKTYYYELDGISCVWENYYNPRRRLCDFYITLFKEGRDGRYDRFDALQRERAYTLRVLRDRLVKSGFEFVGAYSNFDFKTATDDDDRIYVVARCKKGD